MSNNSLFRLRLKDILTALYRAYISPTKMKRSYSQCGEDAVLMYLFAGKAATGYYVDVGCHHPRRGSNTFALYRKGWHGILVDMEPAKTIACKLARPRDRVVLAALSDTVKEVEIYAPSNFSVLATINPSTIDERFEVRGKVTTRTLTDVLEAECAPSEFDLLCIDAEGSDLAVLKGLDFNRFRPSYICIEQWDIDKNANICSYIESTEIFRFAEARGYVLTAVFASTIIFRAA